MIRKIRFSVICTNWIRKKPRITTSSCHFSMRRIKLMKRKKYLKSTFGWKYFGLVVWMWKVPGKSWSITSICLITILLISRKLILLQNWILLISNRWLHLHFRYYHPQLQCVSFQIHNVLEHRDQHGRRIYIFRPGRWDPDKISLQDMFCGGYAMSEMIAMETKYAIMR